MYGLSYLAFSRSYVGTRWKPKVSWVWVSLPQLVRVPNFWRALASAHRSAAQKGQACEPMKKMGTFAPGSGVCDTILKMPASGRGFTSIGRVHPTALAGALPVPPGAFPAAAELDPALAGLAAADVADAAAVPDAPVTALDGAGPDPAGAAGAAAEPQAARAIESAARPGARICRLIPSYPCAKEVTLPGFERPGVLQTLTRTADYSGSRAS